MSEDKNNKEFTSWLDVVGILGLLVICLGALVVTVWIVFG